MMTKGLYTSNKDSWSTPQWLFDKLDNVFHFTLDVAANMHNYKCNKWFGPNEDGLAQDWSNEVCWMNPPYGREIGNWVKKAYESKTTVACLLPARTDTKWFHDWVAHKADHIGFIKGRVSFVSYDGDGYKESPAPFPSMIVIYKAFSSTRTLEAIYNSIDGCWFFIGGV